MLKKYIQYVYLLLLCINHMTFAQESSDARISFPVGMPMMVGESVQLYSSHKLFSQLRADMRAGTTSDRFMNIFKGDLVESMVHNSAIHGATSELRGWTPISPAKIGRTGIDHIFFDTDRAGNIQGAMVVESKAYSSRPGSTSYGPQMSKQWQTHNLKPTASMYRNLHLQLGKANISLQKVSSPTPKDAILVPMPNRRSIWVWEEGGNWKFSGDAKNVSLESIRTQLKRSTIYLQGMADGKISWRSRYFRYTYDGGDHCFSFRDVDLNTGKPLGYSSTPIKGPYSKLPKEFKAIFDKNVTQKLREYFPSATVDEIQMHLQSSRDDPKYLAQLQHEYEINKKALERAIGTTIKAGIITGVVSVLIDLASQALMTQRWDWRQTAKMAGIGLAAGAAGSLVSSGTTFLLTTTPIGRQLTTALAGSIPSSATAVANLISNTAGAFGITAVFAYLPYFLGWTNIHAANEAMLTGSLFGSGVFLASGGLVTIVSAFGTAGTGAAISSLSGAAATNAALAWLGFGSIASGGGGVALGSSIAAASTGVGAILAAAIVGHQAWRYLTSLEQQNRFIEKEFEVRLRTISN